MKSRVKAIIVNKVRNEMGHGDTCIFPNGNGQMKVYRCRSADDDENVTVRGRIRR